MEWDISLYYRTFRYQHRSTFSKRPGMRDLDAAKRTSSVLGVDVLSLKREGFVQYLENIIVQAPLAACAPKCSTSCPLSFGKSNNLYGLVASIEIRVHHHRRRLGVVRNSIEAFSKRDEGTASYFLLPPSTVSFLCLSWRPCACGDLFNHLCCCPSPLECSLHAPACLEHTVRCRDRHTSAHTPFFIRDTNY